MDPSEIVEPLQLSFQVNEWITLYNTRANIIQLDTYIDLSELVEPVQFFLNK